MTAAVNIYQARSKFDSVHCNKFDISDLTLPKQKMRSEQPFAVTEMVCSAVGAIKNEKTLIFMLTFEDNIAYYNINTHTSTQLSIPPG